MSRPPSQIRYGNRLIQQKQQTVSLQKHYQSLRNVRPLTGLTHERDTIVTINNKKKDMLHENRFTQIQRQNRMLFHKITSIMSKGTISQNIKQNDNIGNKIMHRTLNGGYRKKQMQSIEYQNAKMLQRLKDKKSSYQANSFQQSWQKNKAAIKRISLHPYILNDSHPTSQNLYQNKFHLNYQKPHQEQIKRIRKIDGYLFLITIRFQKDRLFIIGDVKEHQSIKVIQLDRKQAQQFVNQECNGDVERIFQMLRYDPNHHDLYLVGRVQPPQKQTHNHTQEIYQSQQKRVMSQHGARARQSKTMHLPPRPLSKQLSRVKRPIYLNEQEQSQLQIKQTIKTQQKVKTIDKQMPQNKLIKVENLIQVSKRQNISNIVENQKKSDWVKLQTEQKDQQQDQLRNMLNNEPDNQFTDEKLENQLIDQNQNQVIDQNQNQVIYQNQDQVLNTQNANEEIQQINQ